MEERSLINAKEKGPYIIEVQGESAVEINSVVLSAGGSLCKDPLLNMNIASLRGALPALATVLNERSPRMIGFLRPLRYVVLVPKEDTSRRLCQQVNHTEISWYLYKSHNR